MNWYYQERGGHTHVRVFMNGGKCGDLVFRNEEFDEIKARAELTTPPPLITFLNEFKEEGA